MEIPMCALIILVVLLLTMQERAAIVLWLTKEQCSPLTRRPLTAEDLRPNRSLQDSINLFRNAGLAPWTSSEIENSNLRNNTNERRAPMSAIVLETSVEVTAVPSAEERQDLLIMGTIKGKDTDLNLNRAPTDIVCVIDRSGSMAGTKIELCRHTLTFIVSQLKETDSLGIVLFDSTVDTLLRLTKMNESGLLHGLCLIEEGNAKIASVMLLTDGRANQGVTLTAQIVEALEQRKITRSSIHTFGIGDHDAEMLKAISDTANGIYYFLQDQDKIPESVGDCLGGLLSVVGTNVTLTIEGVNGLCAIEEVITKFPKTPVEGNQSTVTIGDIQCGEEKNILCRVSIPRISEVGRFEIGKFRLSYAEARALNANDGVSQHSQVVTAEQGVWLERTDDGLESKEASALANENQLEQARELITTIMEGISLSVSHEDPYCQSLLEDLRDCLRMTVIADYLGHLVHFVGGMRDRSSHSFQRSNTATKSYGTLFKKKTQFDSADWSMKKMIEQKEPKTDAALPDTASEVQQANNATSTAEPTGAPRRLSRPVLAISIKKKRIPSGVWTASNGGVTRVESVKGLSCATQATANESQPGETGGVALNQSSQSIPNTNEANCSSKHELPSEAIVHCNTNNAIAMAETNNTNSAAIAETATESQPIVSVPVVNANAANPTEKEPTSEANSNDSQPRASQPDSMAECVVAEKANSSAGESKTELSSPSESKGTTNCNASENSSLDIVKEVESTL